MNTPTVVQIGAHVDRELKREAFSILAKRELPFSKWLAQKLFEEVQEDARRRQTAAAGREE